MVHSSRFPTLVTLTVGSHAESSPVSTSSAVGAEDSWVLPFIDAKNQRKRMLPLHTLDIYFWTVEDADQFLDSAALVLPPQQLESDRQVHQAPAVPEPAVSRVVEQLENVAITDPAYQNGQTRDSRSEPQSTNKEPVGDEKTDYTPLAYNPAAPAAPEPIKHREETPPPEDGGNGTGLVAAAVADEHHSYLPVHGTTSPPHPQIYANPGLVQYSYPTGAPSTQPPMSPGLATLPSYVATAPLASPPPHPSQAGGMTFAPPPAQNPNAQFFPQQQSFDSQLPPYLAQQQQQQKLNPMQHHHHSHHPQYPDYLQSQTQPSSSSHDDERVALNGGYSNYSYDQTMQHQYGQLRSEYDIHNHIYIPTEAELKGSKHGKNRGSKSSSKGTKVESGLSRMDSKVNGFLKKIEKKIG